MSGVSSRKLSISSRLEYALTSPMKNVLARDYRRRHFREHGLGTIMDSEL